MWDVNTKCTSLQHNFISILFNTIRPHRSIMRNTMLVYTMFGLPTC